MSPSRLPTAEDRRHESGGLGRHQWGAAIWPGRLKPIASHSRRDRRGDYTRPDSPDPTLSPRRLPAKPRGNLSRSSCYSGWKTPVS